MTPQKILLGHGSGGKLSQQLIEHIFVPAFTNPMLSVLNDQAVFPVAAGRLAFTTDSFVVDPIFFPGGNIGDLAVNGTVNDLAMSGAVPQYLSCGFIIEAGFLIADLKMIVESMRLAALKARVQIITGDTKVVECRAGKPQLFINTAGIGFLRDGLDISAHQARPGDVVIVSGPIGEHGIAVLSKREGFHFSVPFVSDTASLGEIVAKLVSGIPEIHVLRDVTRGGLATILNEIAEAATCGITLDEGKIPVKEAVGGACEMLGFDPVYVACEGRFVIILPERYTATALHILHNDPAGTGAAVIGAVIAEPKKTVLIKTFLGSERILQRLQGEQLPRIC